MVPSTTPIKVDYKNVTTKDFVYLEIFIFLFRSFASRHIFFITYWFKPFIRNIFTRNLYCQMRKPFIRCSTMPVLYFCLNIDAVTRLHFYSVFAFFLIISSSGNTYQDLPASTFCMMDVPVISALNWTPPPQSLVVASFNGIHICALCESFLTSSFYQVIFLFLPRSKPLLQG